MKAIKICMLMLLISNVSCFANWQPIGYSPVYTAPAPSMDSIRYDMERFNQMQRQNAYQQQIYRNMEEQRLMQMQRMNYQNPSLRPPQVDLNRTYY